MPIAWDEPTKITWDEPKAVLNKPIPEPVEMPFKAKHPNLYGLGMGAVETAKDLSKVSFFKYVYPEEREELKRLSNETTEGGSNLGTRKMLWDTLEAVTIVGFKPLTQGGKTVLKKYLPKTYKLLFETPIGKGKPKTVAQKIKSHKAKTGEHPPQEKIKGWWAEADKKSGFEAKPIAEQVKPVVAAEQVAPKGKPALEQAELPKYAQSVNLEKQNISTQAKKLELGMEEPKKFQGWDETGELSKAILEDTNKVNEAMKKVKAVKGLTENIETARQVTVNKVSELARLGEDLKVGKITKEEFDTAFTSMKENIFKVTSEGSSEIGRALNVHKKVLSETDHMVKGLAKIEEGMTKKQIDEFVDVVRNGNSFDMARFTAELQDPKVKDYVLEYWYNSILSGPPTHAVNTISNTLWATYQVGHKAHTALWDKLYSGVTGKQRTRLLGEIVPSFAGFKTGVKKGGSAALEVVRTGKVQGFESKWAQEVGMSSVGAWERSPNKFMRKVAPILSAPTRALRAMDVFMNSIAYDMEMASIAARKGILKGHKGKELKSFTDGFIKNPSDDAHREAMKFAKHSTFMDDPDPFTDWVLQSRKIPVIGPASQFVVPFVNTIGNLTKRGLELTPGVGIAKNAISRKMGRGLSTPSLIAKQIEGSIVSLYMLYKADMGDITGAAPQNAAERERFYSEGKKPWSVRVGDTWIQYRRMEPFNTVLANTAIAYDAIKNAKDEDSATKIFAKMVGDFKNNLIDSSYFQGMQQLFNRHQKLEKAPQRMAASFVPFSSFWRSINRAYEKATLGDAKVRTSDTWLGAFAQVIPGLSGKVPAKLNIWGDEIVNPGSILQHWLPYKWSKETTDPVEVELGRLNKALKELPDGARVYPGQPGQTVKYHGEKIKLSDEQYRSYLIDLGHQLRTKYEETMNGQGYKNRSDEQKAKMLNNRTRRTRDKVRSKMLKKITKRRTNNG